MIAQRPLRVFLCHASQDKAIVRVLYNRLISEGWVEPWLDEEKILPGQDWDLEINKALRDSDAIIVCLSTISVAKEGYVQKEFKQAIDFSSEKPDGTIYIIPLRLDDCRPPIRFQQWQWLDYFSDSAYSKLLRALQYRLETKPADNTLLSLPAPVTSNDHNQGPIEFCKFIIIDAEATPDVFWIGKYPVTNGQYERFLDSRDFSEIAFWKDLPLFDRTTQSWVVWETSGMEWLEENIKQNNKKWAIQNRVKPPYWDDPNFGSWNRDNPVVGITWWEANAYCKWLKKHWNELAEARANPELNPQIIRLPSKTEWLAAAGGASPMKRYPWDTRGVATTDIKEIILRANVRESNIGHTTPVDNYPASASTYGVKDMAGNVYEWLAEAGDADYLSVMATAHSWADDANRAYAYCCQASVYADKNEPMNGFRAIIYPLKNH